MEKTDPALAAAIRSELDRQTGHVEFGLHFERHLPELIRLPKRKIEAGDKVVRVDDEREYPDIATVATARRGKARLVAADGSTSEQRLDDVVPVSEFGDPVYPGLRPLGSLDKGAPDDPHHVVINGENYHALQTLRYTHANGIDLTYIDPPYNTGSDKWIYNDRYTSATDGYRHSKWLSFMERRLKLARELLKPTGIIIVAIGDDEHHRLRMLMDQVFQARNFVSDVVWQGGRKNGSRLVSNGADYMLIYSKDLSAWEKSGVKVKDAPDVHTLRSDQIKESGARWRVEKAGLEEVLAQGVIAWREARLEALESAAKVAKKVLAERESQGPLGDEEFDEFFEQSIASRPELDRKKILMDAETHGERIMRAFYRSMPKGSVVKEKFGRYNYFLHDGTLCSDTDATWPGGGGPDYDVLHPLDGKPVPTPDRGWVYPTPERMKEMIDDGWIIFRKDHTKPIRLKKPLEKTKGTVPLSVFDRQRTHGSRHLYYSDKDKNQHGVFTEKRFPNPKDHEVLMDWIRPSMPKDAVILDFFGGSGSTLEAIMRLNAEDGGIRQGILVTNNEVSAADHKRLAAKGWRKGDREYEKHGVFEYVTKPRIETVVTGVRTDGSEYPGGTIDANVDFFELTYESRDQVELAEAFEAIDPLLWLKAGARGDRVGELRPAPYLIAGSYAVLFNPDASREFVRRVSETEGLRRVYVVTDSDSVFAGVNAALRGIVPSTRLYSSYLSTFEINTSQQEA